MRLGSRSFIVLTFLALTACSNRPPVATTQPPVIAALPPPPAPPTIEPALREFAAGAYETAAVDFDEYLKKVPSGGQRDDAFFYLGMLSVVSGSPDWERAKTYFDQLLTEFPQTHHKPVVQVLLSLRKETTELASNVERANREAARLQTEADDLRNSLNTSTEKLTSLTTKVDQLGQEAERDKQRIKELNTQLDRLIKIDSGPRPR
jgi:TolA-binding protein